MAFQGRGAALLLYLLGMSLLSFSSGRPIPGRTNGYNIKQRLLIHSGADKVSAFTTVAEQTRSFLTDNDELPIVTNLPNLDNEETPRTTPIPEPESQELQTMTILPDYDEIPTMASPPKPADFEEIKTPLPEPVDNTELQTMTPPVVDYDEIPTMTPEPDCDESPELTPEPADYEELQTVAPLSVQDYDEIPRKTPVPELNNVELQTMTRLPDYEEIPTMTPVPNDDEIPAMTPDPSEYEELPDTTSLGPDNEGLKSPAATSPASPSPPAHDIAILADKIDNNFKNMDTAMKEQNKIIIIATACISTTLLFLVAAVICGAILFRTKPKEQTSI
ncbi:putative uncharacterized protein DDB_G0290521 [Dendropsophus ebraccatus]|uniref:putative uncharacterized protein DDB_G0290521 n=1 Tax=Dendropsophus ebraccatus TaxID=150705 RepID=UPI003831F3C4